MATLMRWWSSGGDSGRCDAKCHDASSPAAECDCMCGGINHGVGQQQAERNTREHGLELLKRAGVDGQIPVAVRQATLFE